MKSYLNQLFIPHPVALQRNLIDSYQWHQWIWGAFPDSPADQRRFLFRKDVQGENVRLLLLSEQKPKPIDGWSWKTRMISAEFLMHNTYRFQVRANPTFRRSADRRRVPLRREADLLTWFQRKLGAAGCRVQSIEVDQPQDVYFYKDGNTGLHISVDARGLIEVTDRHAFQTAFSEGIGPAKGFGFGLLMVQPVAL